MLRLRPLWPGRRAHMKVKVAARSYRSQTAKYSKSHEYSCLLFSVGTLRDQRHVTLLPPPATVFLLELSVCIVCEAKLVGLCVCVCVREMLFWGLMGARQLQGQCLCSARDCARWHTRAHKHTHTHARAHTWHKQRLIVDTHAQPVRPLQSHIVSLFALVRRVYLSFPLFIHHGLLAFSFLLTSLTPQSTFVLVSQQFLASWVPSSLVIQLISFIVCVSSWRFKGQLPVRVFWFLVLHLNLSSSLQFVSEGVVKKPDRGTGISDAVYASPCTSPTVACTASTTVFISCMEFE